MVTFDWSLRVNFTIFGIIIVDTWLAFKGCTSGSYERETQSPFYEFLAEELIDNTFDRIGTRRWPVLPITGVIQTVESPTCCTPTKRKRWTRNGNETPYTFQGRCIECGHKCTLVCSGCTPEGELKEEIFVCRTDFQSHIAIHHM